MKINKNWNLHLTLRLVHKKNLFQTHSNNVLFVVNNKYMICQQNNVLSAKTDNLLIYKLILVR